MSLEREGRRKQFMEVEEKKRRKKERKNWLEKRKKEKGKEICLPL
jgi:hypothetical protein